VFENRVLSRTSGPKREEVEGGWRRPHNEELHDLYASSYIIRMSITMRMRWVGHVAHMGEMRNAYKTLATKPEQKTPPQRLRR
jgi:hypothetical protein